MATPYDTSFFDSIQHSASSSAAVVVPLLHKLIAPTSVVDIGCAEGQWLQMWLRLGCSDIWGVDGDYVDRDKLVIPQTNFQAVDLNRPLRLERRFDLATCFEVGEHLEPTASETLIASLTALAPVVAFSAAVPGQGGTDHINEQWPAYWAAIFKRCGFDWVDGVRQHLWNDSRVSWWYRQNILLFAQPDVLPRIREAVNRLPPAQSPLALPHPESYQERCVVVNNLLQSTQRRSLPARIISRLQRGLTAR